MSDHSTSNVAEQKYDVTPLELFFDLVFAFALSQLSQHLFSHLSWRGGVETLVMLVAVFAAWFTTSWSATLVRADQSRTRWLMLTVMLLGLFMNAAVMGAFTRSGWAFIVPMLSIQLGRTIWTLLNSDNPVLREHYLRTLLWLIATTPLWIAGATASTRPRLIWWALAASIDQIGRWLAHPIPGRRLESENVGFDADHMLERCRLFLLIALGETVLTTGSAIASAPLTLVTVATGTFALAGTVGLWSFSYGRSHRLIIGHADRTSDPIRASRYAVNAVLVMVAGLIAVAVANKEVIARPRGETSLTLSLLLAGGPIMFLVAQAWYLWFIPKVRPRLHMVGSAVLLIIGAVALMMSPFTALLLIGACLTALAILDR